ncbi:MAG: CocE/NonD family hydrolase, partial [Candidatus Aminicenantes bacterium]|nr:CocE/NonD family hydrolase [Candidatus Aminicenantes bacterium]
KRQAALAVILLISLAGLGAQDAAQAKQEAAAPEVRPLPISGFEETGVFKLFVRESEIARLEYALTKDGQYTRKFIISMAGQKSEDTLTISSNAQGEWESMRIVAPTETVNIKRVGDTVELKLEKKGQSYSAKLEQGHILYDNYGPVFESLMLRAYDTAKKGVQKFPRFLIPSKSVTVDLEYKGQDIRTVKGRDVEFQRFNLNLIGIEVGILADAEHRIYLMDVPVQQAAFVREGYEDLLAAGPKDPLLSQPQYEVRKETVMIPMRDGVRLATDLYFPVAENVKFPVVLIRTPYKKDMDEINGKYYARRGYVAAIQDCRGRFASEGQWEPFVDEPKDGYDTIEWLGTRDWASGKVGMIGGSYVGWVQLWAASAKPPHLTAIIPNVAPPDPFFNIPYEYGSFFILGAIWWAEILEKEATGDLSGRVMAEINERKYEQIFKSLPVIDLDQKILGRRNVYWRKWIEHNTNDTYWEKANFMEKLKTLDIPVLLQSGWFDGDGIGSKLNYAALRQSRNKFIKLILGPWGHTDQSSSKLGDFDFGKDAAPDLQMLYVRWFDYWLKGVDNKIAEEPLVQYFVMFSNTWLKGDTYPLPETKFTKFYLGSTKGANTSRGDGMLRAELGSGGRAFDEFVYDPGDPTPWPEYYFKSEEEIEREKKKTVNIEEAKKKAKAFHNSVTDARQDILVFQTEPLAEPVSVAGPLSAALYASTSAPDTDWFVTLMDVDEKGEIFHLVRGTIRARFRNSMAKPEFLEKNKIYRYDLDMWQTGITFQKGHRIRVEVASAFFPMFSRNLNTGGHNEKETKYQKATQRIYHSAEYPSHVLLPVVDIKK